MATPETKECAICGEWYEYGPHVCMNKKPKLLPCPFCGHPAELQERWGDCSKRPDWYEVECTNPGCGHCHDTEAEAIEWWNSRAN